MTDEPISLMRRRASTFRHRVLLRVAAVWYLGYSPDMLLTDQSDYTRLRKVAKAYNDLRELELNRRRTEAEMLRGCIAKLRSSDSRVRAEAIKYLSTLADMMERTK